MIDAGALTLREKAAQLLFPRLGSNLPPPVTAAEDVDRFERLLERCPVGGLVLFNGRYPQTAEALARLQRKSAVPLLVCADMERGAGQQIRGATVFPHAMAFSALGADAERMVQAAARVQAREALGCGVHVTFSPVADVNRDPANPIIATRAYSSDPDRAARLAAAFVRGCRSEGVLCTAKHFPGHGNTSRDSHAELPVVDSSRVDLEAFDFVPFRAAIDAGVDLVMTAHVLYPALDPDRPATLSARILRNLLRDELGFEGAVVTDSLLMGAIRPSHVHAGEQAAALVAAGVDILLDVPEPEAAAEGIARAVEDGRLAEEHVDASLERVLTLKRRVMDRFGGAFFASPSSVIGADEIGAEPSGALAVRVAERAITIFDDADGRLPVHPPETKKVVALLLKPHRTRLDPDEEPFLDLFREAVPRAWCRQVDRDADAAMMDEIRRELDLADLAVMALVVKPAAWHAFGLQPEQDALVRFAIARVPTIVASLGSPYVLDAYEGAAARLCTYSDVEASQQALVRRLVSRR